MRSIWSTPFCLQASSAVAALRGIGRYVIILSLGLLGMSQRSPRAIERLRVVDWNGRERLDEFEEGRVRRFPIDVVGLITNGIALAAFHSMIVIIENFPERPLVNHCLVPLDAWALLPFEGFDG